MTKPYGQLGHLVIDHKMNLQPQASSGVSSSPLASNRSSCGMAAPSPIMRPGRNTGAGNRLCAVRCTCSGSSPAPLETPARMAWTVAACATAARVASSSSGRTTGVTATPPRPSAVHGGRRRLAVGIVDDHLAADVYTHQREETVTVGVDQQRALAQVGHRIEPRARQEQHEDHGPAAHGRHLERRQSRRALRRPRSWPGHGATARIAPPQSAAAPGRRRGLPQPATQLLAIYAWPAS